MNLIYKLRWVFVALMAVALSMAFAVLFVGGSAIANRIVDTAFSLDMEVEYSYPDTTYKLPHDSVSWMSPSETRRFINKYIRQQRGGKR